VAGAAKLAPEAVQNLRQELTLAIEAGADNAIRFECGTVELELQVELLREGTDTALKVKQAGQRDVSPGHARRAWRTYG